MLHGYGGKVLQHPPRALRGGESVVGEGEREGAAAQAVAAFQAGRGALALVAHGRRARGPGNSRTGG
jgi:hypothetical protein